MGDLQTDQGERLDLSYVPVSEFRRLIDTSASPIQKTEAFSALARINVLYMITGAWSGHIGTSFSSLEIMSWLFLNEIRDLDRGPSACDIFFSSKGHDAPALYAVLVGLGLLPAEQLHRLRRLSGLPGHPHVETPFVQANTGSLGMGISKAKGMALANRLTGISRRIFVLTGDGELQEGQFWESLGSAANLGLGEIVVLVDHNKIQSDTWVTKVNDLGNLEAKFSSFGWHVSRCNGHDVAELERTFRVLDSVIDQPKVIVADTIKGCGVSFMEGENALRKSELYLFHSGAPTEQQYREGFKELFTTAQGYFKNFGLGNLQTETQTRNSRRQPQKTDNLVASYSQALVQQAKRNSQLVVLDADLIKDCGLIDFSEAYPSRFIECGIGEQDMVSMAGGMARRGALPVAHSFACFLSARPNEQIYNQCSESSKVIYVGSLAGLLPGGPGHSHQCVRDISALGAIPNLLMVEPATESEVTALFDYVVNSLSCSTYLRLVSVKWPLPFEYPDDHLIKPGCGWVVRPGTDGVAFGYGPWLLANAWHAAEEIKRTTGLDIKVVNLPWLNHVDIDWFRETLGDYRTVITMDNHYLHGGQGEMLASASAELGLTPALQLTRIGITNLPVCGTNDEVLAHHRLDVEGLVARFSEALGMQTPVASISKFP